MKNNLLIFALLVITMVGCGNPDDSGNNVGPDPLPPIISPIWESYSHATQMNFKQAVKSVKATYPVTDEPDLVFTDMVATFDNKGNCTSYDATGIELEGQSLRGTRNNWIEAVKYDYTYDAQGRMSSAAVLVAQAQPRVYTITYGNHSTYVATPFPLGPIKTLMLKGVARIQSEGYLLECDGIATTAKAQIAGWPRSIQESSWTLVDNLPAECRTIAYSDNGGEKGEQIWTEKTIYGYTKKWLTRLEVERSTADGDSQRTVTNYSDKWPSAMISKAGYMGDVPEAEFQIDYTYAENGLPTGAKYVVGAYFDPEFGQHYTAYDQKDNWIGSIRKVEDAEFLLTRAIAYY